MTNKIESISKEERARLVEKLARIEANKLPVKELRVDSRMKTAIQRAQDCRDIRARIIPKDINSASQIWRGADGRVLVRRP